MQIWIIYSIIYAIFNGIYNCSKKKATEKSNLYVILPIMTLLSFLLVTLTTKDAFPISLNNLLVIFFKSLIISISWILNMYAIKQMTLSLYGIINISSIIFVQILSFMILKEAITINMMIGMFIIILGIVLVNIISNNKQTKETNITSIILLLFSCFLSAISCIIDKMILKNISSSQLQFWFLLFLSIIFGIILLNRIKSLCCKI